MMVYSINDVDTMYMDLYRSVNFEDITRGRKGAIIVDCKSNKDNKDIKSNKNSKIPIVRTTTSYKNRASTFDNIHYSIIEDIKRVTSKDLHFNNAMIELYSTEYKKMKFHSDQDLDLEENSYICILSLYNNPQTESLRRLVVKDKKTGDISSITLYHGSIVLFSIETNRQYRHKIVLENSKDNDTVWLGVTLRLSGTFITFKNNMPYIEDDILTLADDRQRREFIRLKSIENEKIDNINEIDRLKKSNINYTLSISDTLYPTMSSLIENSIKPDIQEKKINNISPINIYNVGLYFRDFFGDKDYFSKIVEEHKFQQLTESSKTGTAYRTGIYITRVDKKNDDLHFNLLRCSSNFNGPTDNMRDTDIEITSMVNKTVEEFFTQPVDANHVLAQVYHNVVYNNKQRKATIKEHSDKTKDMPKNGIIAFCTFYKFNIDTYNKDNDYCHNNTSVLTKLRFRLKDCEKYPELEKKFDVVLYPNSLLIIPLSTNRIYTHEIVPSTLPIEMLPTRMGYVVRCSNKKAVFKNEKVYIVEDNEEYPLEEQTDEGVKRLKKQYVLENTTDNSIVYDKFNFSLNRGDYTKPIY